jgi:putative colanic acid biosynthesis UDP-glucose lipid carrier transferase
MIHRYSNFNRILNILVDYFLINISLLIVYSVMHHTLFDWFFDKSYIHVILVFNLLWLLSANLVKLYVTNADVELKIIIKKSVQAYLLYVILVCYVIMYVNNIKSYHITSDYLFFSMSLYGILFCAWKLLFIKGIRHSTIFHGSIRRAVIVGGGRAGVELYNRFKNDLIKGYQLLGIFDDQPLKVPSENLYLGNIALCMPYIIENKIDEIFCALPLSENKTIERLIRDSDKNLIRFKLVPEHYEYFQGALFKQSINHIDAFSIRIEPLENMMNRFVKRLFDIVFSLFVIVFVLSWLFPILYILIKLESPGPVLFVQARSGRNNMPFDCYKFRSMHINEDSHHLQATKGDSRITKIGAFLRKTSLDEMPQFFNVLMGTMSVVGPRPHMLTHTKQYSKEIDQFMVRHFIKPGITGWAQIQGLRGETKLLEDMRARVEADVWYMENWNFALDIKIIFFTFFKTIIGDKYAF